MPQTTMPPSARSFAIILALILIGVPAPAGAVMSGDESARAPSSDADYAAGVTAFEHGDWAGVIEHMTKVIERRPWHDNAHSLMGFAYRKQGDYARSLQFYDQALALNPHNRGALEYLGEAYLEMGQPEQAKGALDRLATECRRIAVGFSNGDWQTGCEEWQELKAAYDAYLADHQPASDQAAR
jgi:tetratricopeptide (TPR) repeat protein